MTQTRASGKITAIGQSELVISNWYFESSGSLLETVKKQKLVKRN